jgi:hypothetical protein
MRLVAEGRNDVQISCLTGIPRRTIVEWRHGRLPGRHRPVRAHGNGCPRCEGAALDEPAYAYLLGLYLGDGWISEGPRTYRLRIVQDARYSELIRLAKRMVVRVRGGGTKVGTSKRVGCVEIYSCWKHWPCLFPQHGPGRKHHRTIALADWQERIVQTYPRQLVRGLIHSDGCRTINRVWNGKYSYPRYFFTNNSEDILRIFRDACDVVGIHHRNSKPNTISVARREDVAGLDAFIGPKK